MATTRFRVRSRKPTSRKLRPAKCHAAAKCAVQEFQAAQARVDVVKRGFFSFGSGDQLGAPEGRGRVPGRLTSEATASEESAPETAGSIKSRRVLPPGDSISAANGIGSRQGRFFFDDLELSPGGPRRRVFLRQRTLRVEVARGRPSSGGEYLVLGGGYAICRCNSRPSSSLRST